MNGNKYKEEKNSINCIIIYMYMYKIDVDSFITIELVQFRTYLTLNEPFILRI